MTHFKVVILLLSFTFLFSNCSQEKKKTELNTENAIVNSSIPDIITSVFKNDTTKDAAFGGFGYRIYVLSGSDTAFRLFQPTIPAIPGQKGFNTFSDAEKVAALAAEKIKAGNSFPTVEIAELDSLGIKY